MSEEQSLQGQNGRGQGSTQQGQQGGQQYQQQRQQASVPLLEGEEVLIDARPAWSAYAFQIILATLFLLGGLAEGGSAVFGGVILAGAVVGYVWWQRKKLRYVVTDRRMMKLMGISSRSTNEAWMQDVRGLQTGASIIERLLGHGHITVSTDIVSSAGSIPGLSVLAVNGMTFGGISNYEEIAQIIRQRQNELKMSGK